MRVVCLVPSWPETLIEAGVDVCGRTRFCIHPKESVTSIPIVGGTKEVDWEKIKNLRPDLIILDQEENPKQFSEKSAFPWLATHVTDLESARNEMFRLGEVLKNKQLQTWADEWDQLLSQPCGPWNPDQVPGEIEKIHGQRASSHRILYVIWKNPWMVVNHKTFIASVLEFLGADLAEIPNEKNYPEVDEDFLKKYQLLFSSEPFPFHKKENELRASGLSGHIVDGESYSWFGIRSLRFIAKARRESLETKV